MLFATGATYGLDSANAPHQCDCDWRCATRNDKRTGRNVKICLLPSALWKPNTTI